MTPQMPRETQPEQQSNGVKAFAARSPFFFVLVFFVVSQCLFLLASFVVPFPSPPFDQVVQSLLAFGVLAWLGWLRLAGFNGPSQWRSPSLFWLPGLVALFFLASFLLTMHVSGASVVVLAVLYALLNALSEEARFRGVILQALLPYGWLRAAALSALFFGLLHVSNLLVYPPLTALGSVFGAFLFGFGYAACRLRTNTIWPLIIFHACADLIPNFSFLNGRAVPAILSSSHVIGSFANSTPTNHCSLEGAWYPLVISATRLWWRSQNLVRFLEELTNLCSISRRQESHVRCKCAVAFDQLFQLRHIAAEVANIAPQVIETLADF